MYLFITFQNRIKTPHVDKSIDLLDNKLLAGNEVPFSKLQNVTHSITTTTTFSSQKRPNSDSLSQRVHEFVKTARYVINKLSEAREKIEAAANSNVVEHLKMSIAPDAAALISQGDTLVLQTHGAAGDLSTTVLKVQTILRERFREVQHARNGCGDKALNYSSQSSSNDEPRNVSHEEKLKNALNQTANVHKDALQVYKKIYQLAQSTLHRGNEEALNHRLLQIQVKILYKPNESTQIGKHRNQLIRS